MSLAQIAKRTERLLNNNSPAILTAVGVTGVIATAVLASKASLRANVVLRNEYTLRYGLIVDESSDNFQIDLRHLTRDDVRLVWKLFIPPVGACALTIAAIIGANRIGNRRAAAVAAAYSISEKAYTEYRDKVAEKFGAGKEMSVRDAIAQDHVTKNPPVSNEIIITGDSDVLFRDEYTGRYFTSTMEKLRKAQNDLNFEVLHNDYVSLSEFYSLIGLAPTEASDDVGWNQDKALELKFSATITSDSRPCICMSFLVAPVRGFHRLH